MKKIRLEARLKEKTLSVNGKKMKLDDSFFSGRTSWVLNRENEDALELGYRTENIDDEAESIYLFLEQEGLLDRVEVNGGYPNGQVPTVALVGEINAEVYN